LKSEVSPNSSDIMKGKLGQIAVAIVEPEFAINVGYLARVMANFGMNRLVIVGGMKIQCELEQACRFASHGELIVRKAKYVKTFQDLRREFSLLVGTTAIPARKKSNIARKVVSPSNCAKILIRNFSLTKEDSDNAICIVFGRDTTGLTNEELSLCHIITSIRTGSAYNTLNVSHAAAIIFFSFLELLRLQSRNLAATNETRDGASKKEQARVVNLLLKLARVSDVQDHRIRKLKILIERIVARTNLSEREAYLLMGLAGKAISKITRLQRKSES
jgi:tRNA/rRNA methyltransferase